MSSVEKPRLSGAAGKAAKGKRQAGRGFLATVAALALLLVPLAGPANGAFGDVAPVITPTFGPNTDIQVIGVGAGQTINGLEPGTTAAPDPAAPYPTTNPDGYVSNSGFAGIINTADVNNPGLTAQMYCINLTVETEAGVGYENGTWSESAVPNIGYVNFILNNYYPATGEPSALGENQRAAAVQAAIWYFTDGYVVNTSQTDIRPTVVQIVAAAQANGPLLEPPAPEVFVTPPVSAAPEDALAGPFTVEANGTTQITVSVPAGFSMFTDATGTTALPDGSVVSPGAQIWVSSDAGTVASTLLTARATVTVQTGNVYLYDGNNPDISDAQRLILAVTTTLNANAQASVEFFAPGDLAVSKAFAGEALGAQGASQLIVDCGAGYIFTADIPAAVSAVQEFTFQDIPAGTDCTVTEPVNGSNAAVTVASTAPQSVTLAEGGSAVTVTNTVTYNPGSLWVTKVLTGNAAGLQGEISVAVLCGQTAGTFVLPAGTGAGEYIQIFENLPAGTECTVTEQATGETAEVAVDAGEPVTVAIQPGVPTQVKITNTVSQRGGNLVLRKVIAGSGAGSQGVIVFNVVCGDVLNEIVRLPANLPARDYFVQQFGGIPAGTQCTVTETTSGENNLVTVDPDLPDAVTIEAGMETEMTVSNTYAVLGKEKLARTGTASSLQVGVAGAGTLMAGMFLVIGSIRSRKG